MILVLRSKKLEQKCNCSACSISEECTARNTKTCTNKTINACTNDACMFFGMCPFKDRQYECCWH